MNSILLAIILVPVIEIYVLIKIGSQIGVKQAWLPSAAVLFLIGIIPGMPNLLFLIAGALAFGVWYYLNRKEISEENLSQNDDNNFENKNSSANTIELDEISDNSQDFQFSDYIESNFLGEQVQSIHDLSIHISHLRKIGTVGHALWDFDNTFKF